MAIRQTETPNIISRNRMAPYRENAKVSVPKVSEKDLLKDLEQACISYDRFLKYL